MRSTYACEDGAVTTEIQGVDLSLCAVVQCNDFFRQVTVARSKDDDARGRCTALLSKCHESAIVGDSNRAQTVTRRQYHPGGWIARVHDDGIAAAMNNEAMHIESMDRMPS